MSLMSFIRNITGQVNYETIKSRYEEADKKFTTAKANDIKQEAMTNKIYTRGLKFLYNTLTSIKNGSNHESKFYFQALEKTGGDYAKREGTINRRVQQIVTSTNKYLTDKKYNNDLFKYSLIGIYHDAYDILSKPSNVTAFKKAFEIANKKGDSNTCVTVFKLTYFALVFFVELATVHLMDFELDILNQLGADKAIDDLHSKYRSFMRNVAYNIIPVNGFFNTMKGNLTSLITKLSSEEDKVRKGLSKESFDYGSNRIISRKELSQEDSTNTAATAATIAGTGVMGIIAATLGVSVYIIIIAIAILIIPLTRAVIYWAGAMKINIGKELELKAEMLDNNIVNLKQKLENTTDKQERARLQEIIDKQMIFVNKWREKSEKLLKEENETGYVVQEKIEHEDSQEDDKGDFEVIL